MVFDEEGEVPKPCIDNSRLLSAIMHSEKEERDDGIVEYSLRDDFKCTVDTRWANNGRIDKRKNEGEEEEKICKYVSRASTYYLTSVRPFFDQR